MVAHERPFNDSRKMTTNKTNKISVDVHLDDIKDIQTILRELKKTVETDGAYCPYNKTYPCQARVVHQIRRILHDEIER